MNTFDLTQLVSTVSSHRPIVFARWLTTYFGAVEYQNQMIEIPDVGVYRLEISSDNTELEVGVYQPINAMNIREMESAGAKLIKNENGHAIFDIFHENEVIGVVKFSVVGVLAHC